MNTSIPPVGLRGVNSESVSVTLIKQNVIKVCNGIEVQFHIFLTLAFDRGKSINVRPLYSLCAEWDSINTVSGHLAEIMEK